MDRQLNDLIAHFSLENLSLFFRAASAKFRPLDADFSHVLKDNSPLDDFVQVGRIEYDEISHLIVAAGHSPRELSSQSGKFKQYEAARQVLQQEDADAGIFVFYDDDGHFRFSLIVTQYLGTKRKHSSYKRYTYFVSPDEKQRTFQEQMLGADFGSITALQEAFSVEKVTKDFFKVYEQIFRRAEAAITMDWDEEQKRLYTQRFFNRLIFLAFVERKGWLNFNGRRSDYLRALFEDYWQNDDEKRPDANFHRKRLNALFFWGLNNARSTDETQLDDFKPLSRLIGDVPFLNGGLFEQEADDEAFFFPDSIVAAILNDLIYRFNFTVAESTPLDVEVAVDPEMLGKIFEELVTGRHESGSYYTPKPVVSFMCKEALKGYLESSLPQEMPAALARFVDETDAAALRDPELALAALRGVRAVDPACGSGAYLLGLLHELLGLRAALFASRHVDGRTVYDRKLEIIQNNLYGVDLDPFAVNIARLRLWLSLIVDFEGEGEPPPLPNLEFKIEDGDSLTAPDPSGGLQPDLFRYGQVQEYFKLKGDFLEAHGEQKIALRDEVRALREKISSWAHDGKVAGFDWQVEFAEVFAPELAKETLSGEMAGLVNQAGGQMGLTAAPKEGGFDIVLANPPYVRQELLGDYKKDLKPVYPEVYTGTADLYVYFYGRAQQLLKKGGTACFISSNKWLRAGYGENLRRHLLDKQAFKRVVDFGELPVFDTAATFPAIFLWQKNDRKNIPTHYAAVKDLQACYDEGILPHVEAIGESLPAKQFGLEKPRLVSRKAAKLREQMGANSVPLGEYVDGKMYRGIITGLNEAFVIDRTTRAALIEKDLKSEEIIKPLLKGDDVRHYETHYREQYLIWTYIDIPIETYPAVFEHLKKHEKKAKKRWDKGKQWWELRACAYYDAFEKPKIIYPDIGKSPRFYLDKSGFFSNNSSYFIALEDWYLLSVLNSEYAFEYMKSTSSVLGSEDAGGRLRFFGQFLETLPIPNASDKEKELIGNLAKEVQALHSQRRAKVEQFLVEIGSSPAASNSRNRLEKPWLLDVKEFEKRAKKYGTPDPARFKLVRDETASLSEAIAKLEGEIDARVASLYGVG
jgi:type I restriction-modification system DNA methylase subunit